MNNDVSPHILRNPRIHNRAAGYAVGICVCQRVAQPVRRFRRAAKCKIKILVEREVEGQYCPTLDQARSIPSRLGESAIHPRRGR